MRVDHEPKNCQMLRPSDFKLLSTFQSAVSVAPAAALAPALDINAYNLQNKVHQK